MRKRGEVVVGILIRALFSAGTPKEVGACTDSALLVATNTGALR
jgi:hypothetical protein